MCGRYAVKLPASVLDVPFVEESAFPQIELPWVHYNVCPGMQAPIVDKNGVLRPAHWGLLPHWSGDRPPRRPLVNARLETAATRPSFRTAWASQRCVVPVSGFYEWSSLSGERCPYFVPPDEGEGGLLWLAGLACATRETDRAARWSYAVLTEASGDSPVEGYHDRVPVALRAASVSDWLQGCQSGPGPRGRLGKPYRVSKKVNSATVNEPSNLTAVEG